MTDDTDGPAELVSGSLLALRALLFCGLRNCAIAGSVLGVVSRTVSRSISAASTSERSIAARRLRDCERSSSRWLSVIDLRLGSSPASPLSSSSSSSSGSGSGSLATTGSVCASSRSAHGVGELPPGAGAVGLRTGHLAEGCGEKTQETPQSKGWRRERESCVCLPTHLCGACRCARDRATSQRCRAGGPCQDPTHQAPLSLRRACVRRARSESESETWLERAQSTE
jgi:hypothetical protein